MLRWLALATMVATLGVVVALMGVASSIESEVRNIGSPEMARAGALRFAAALVATIGGALGVVLGVAALRSRGGRAPAVTALVVAIAMFVVGGLWLLVAAVAPRFRM